VDDEAALDAGQVFGKKYLERLREANFGVLRFLGWQEGNSGNTTTWDTRKPVDYVYYQGNQFRSDLYAGVTTNVGNAYSASLPGGFTLKDKATVTIKFNVSAQPGPCTLNVNGTGAINILGPEGNDLNKNSYPVGGTGQSMATLVYDATLKSWLKQGGEITFGSRALANGYPPEIMVRLCAEIGAHPYFVTPYFSLDPLTDYMPSLADYCRDHAPGWMIPRFEGPNELWNGAFGYFGSNYSILKGRAYGWGDNDGLNLNNWYGKGLSVLGQAISQVYGGNRKRYQVLCGVQTANGELPLGVGGPVDFRLTSQKYVNQAEDAQEGYEKSPAKDWVTHVCVVNYYSPSDYNTPAETRAAAEWANATPARQKQLEDAYAATCLSGNGRFTIPKLAVMYANWKQWALSHGIKNMCAYEGGYSPDYTGGGATVLDKFRGAAKISPMLKTATLQDYQNFIGLTDAGFTAEFPSCLKMTGNMPSTDAWAILEDIYQYPDPPQWTAIVEFNKVKP
jgi:hypothetical protein